MEIKPEEEEADMIDLTAPEEREVKDVPKSYRMVTLNFYTLCEEVFSVTPESMAFLSQNGILARHG